MKKHYFMLCHRKNKNIVSRLVLVVRYKLGGVEKASKSGEHPFEALQLGAFKTQALKEQAPRGRGSGKAMNETMGFFELLQDSGFLNPRSYQWSYNPTINWLGPTL